MLDGRQLSLIRETVEASLDITVDLLTPNAISDGRGGMDRSFTISHAGIRARIAERTGKEAPFMGREDVIAEYVLTVAHDQDVDETARVDHNGQLYEVVFVNTDKSYGTARRCLIHRL